MDELPFQSELADALDSSPTDATELDGGEIGTVYRVELADGRTVVTKTGDTPLRVEARMLRYLAAETDLPVPTVYHANYDLLVLEFVSGDSTFSESVERDAADYLADLHEVSDSAFGFPFDTLTGSVRQPNPWTDSWVEFYRMHRVEYMTELAHESGALSDALAERVDDFAADLSAILEEPDSPGLVHGDVWTQNVLAGDDSVRAFLDPATYFAHPEIELAYVDWTDTFGEAFFDRYRERHDIAPGFFEERRDAYVVYPLLTHVYYFGEQYCAELDRTLRRLTY
ncbi:fructosamine kinase family protein [Halorussus halophilus]|uniref:fructosamine kinase family protein n=1 Tax=Halorussus halophilus TaxID=2650975 RepID=UPI001301530F|nr:fructosamine kinase family protein [Halorussus halophilus]